MAPVRATLLRYPRPGPTTERAALTVQPGQHLGQYELLEPLGKGGMATVFRFRRSGVVQALVVQFATNFKMRPPAAATLPSGPHACCQDFDVYVAPTSPGLISLFKGPQPQSVPAAVGEEQLFVLSVRGPLIVAYIDGLEIARIPDAPVGSGGIALQVWATEKQRPAVLRLLGLELYEASAER